MSLQEWLLRKQNDATPGQEHVKIEAEIYTHYIHEQYYLSSMYVLLFVSPEGGNVVNVIFSCIDNIINTNTHIRKGSLS